MNTKLDQRKQEIDEELEALLAQHKAHMKKVEAEFQEKLARVNERADSIAAAYREKTHALNAKVVFLCHPDSSFAPPKKTESADSEISVNESSEVTLKRFGRTGPLSHTEQEAVSVFFKYNPTLDQARLNTV